MNQIVPVPTSNDANRRNERVANLPANNSSTLTREPEDNCYIYDPHTKERLTWYYSIFAILLFPFNPFHIYSFVDGNSGYLDFTILLLRSDSQTRHQTKS